MAGSMQAQLDSKDTEAHLALMADDKSDHLLPFLDLVCKMTVNDQLQGL